MAMANPFTPPRVQLRNSLAMLPTRAALGGSMIFHGLGKLRGEGPAQSGAFFEQIGLKPGKPLAIATGLAETFAGAASILGLFTRPAAIAVLVTQAFAVAKVHFSKGYDITKGGYEYNLGLMAIAAAMLIAGPGPISAHEELECLLEGKGAKRLFRKARPTWALRLAKLVK